MRRFFTFIATGLLALFLHSCTSNSSGTSISGQLTNAQNLKAYIDKVVIGKAKSVVQSTEIDGNGNFRFNFEEGIDPGIYSLRIGRQQVDLYFDGTEKDVVINGDLTKLGRYEIEISGAPHSQTLAETMNGVVNRKINSDNISEFVNNAEEPLLGAYVAFKTLGGNGQFLPILQQAHQKLVNTLPNDPSTKEYGNYINLISRQVANQRATQLIQIGQPAPDISLSDPYGKEFSLSELKGKIVLLDFWASWCGPCRRENPNVVKVYEKYKDQGFTVYSVSLDGLDSRSKARLNTEAQVNTMLERSKDRWVQAIAQDGLIWDYHVSDLKKWESAPASTYGVRSIPRTFLIDRDGNIAATNLRGARQIENELVKLL